MNRRIVIAFMLATLVAAADARAQAPGRLGRGFISVNGGYQATSTSFTNGVSFTKYAETGNFDANYRVKSGAQFDAGGGVRLWRGLAVGIGVSRFANTRGASVSAQIPHPFFFGKSRAVSGQTADLKREETGVHIQAMWMVPAGPHFDIGVFGGPTVYSVKQGLVSGVNYSEAYPYDSATFTGATTQGQSKSKVGFNVGVDLTYLFSRNVGVGGLIRFSRASIDFSGPDGRKFSVDAGGAQVGAGLRLRF